MFVGIYTRNHQKPGFLRLCEMDFATIHGMSSVCVLFQSVRWTSLAGWDKQGMRNGMSPRNHPLWFLFRGIPGVGSFPTPGLVVILYLILAESESQSSRWSFGPLAHPL